MGQTPACNFGVHFISWIHEFNWQRYHDGKDAQLWTVWWFCETFQVQPTYLFAMELESVVVVINKPKQGSQTKPQYRNLVTSFGKLKESIHQKNVGAQG